MTPQQIVGIAVRLFSIWLGLTALQFFIAGNSLEEQRLIWLGIAIFILLVAIALWFFPMTVAHKIIPRTKYDNVLHIQAYEFARVGGGLMGLWLIAQSLSVLVAIVGFTLSDTKVSASIFDLMSAEIKIDFIEKFISFSIGIILIFKSAKIARFISGINPTVNSSNSEK